MQLCRRWWWLWNWFINERSKRIHQYKKCLKWHR